MQKKIILYIILIIVILVLVFLSQQAYSRAIGKNLISAATSQVSAYLTKGTHLVMPNIGSEISSQAQNGGAAIQNAIDQGKQKISDTEKNIQNYFSGIKDAVEGKTTTSCPVQNSTN